MEVGAFPGSPTGDLPPTSAAECQMCTGEAAPTPDRCEVMLHKGVGGKVNQRRARSWWRLAARGGKAQARVRLGALPLRYTAERSVALCAPHCLISAPEEVHDVAHVAFRNEGGATSGADLCCQIAQSQPNPGRIWPLWVEVGRTWPTAPQIRKSSTNTGHLGPNSTTFAPISTDFGPSSGNYA